MQQLISRLSVPIKILVIISIKANKKVAGKMRSPLCDLFFSLAWHMNRIQDP